MIAFVRIAAGEHSPRTILAVWAGHLDDVVSQLVSMPGLDIDQVPDTALPGVAEACAEQMGRVALELAFRPE
ncbi:hypothetical protein, partial [Sphaerisporangium album]|uniref:hypothetical protein n=1 Tax=Sphaerisporangium album TaxID=509200 RepID=UPI001C688F67